MIKRRIIILLIIAICFISVGCGNTGGNGVKTAQNGGAGDKSAAAGNVGIKTAAQKEEDEIVAIIKEIFDAYNSKDDAKITETLKKYINPELCKAADAKGPNRNAIVAGDTVLYNADTLSKDNSFTLDDYRIMAEEKNPVVLGYVSGSISNSGKTENGPWGLSSRWYKSGGSWYLEYLSLSKLDVPKLEYYPQVPTNYEKDSGKKWPLIIFMHGVGERGGKLDDLRNMNHSIPRLASTTRDFPFVVVSPLCPANYSWKELPYSINNLIDEVTKKYNIDTDRIYLTGLSLGGIGTWYLAKFYPDKFAAVAPVCGYTDADKLDRIKNLPIWAFHGALDTVVPMAQEQEAVDALKAMGGDIQYTVYPDVEHDAWNKAYATKELYDWFLQHRLSERK